MQRAAGVQRTRGSTGVAPSGWGASRCHRLLAACCRGLDRRSVFQLRVADQLLVDLAGKGRKAGEEDEA